MKKEDNTQIQNIVETNSKLINPKNELETHFYRKQNIKKRKIYKQRKTSTLGWWSLFKSFYIRSELRFLENAFSCKLYDEMLIESHRVLQVKPFVVAVCCGERLSIEHVVHVEPSVDPNIWVKLHHSWNRRTWSCWSVSYML